MRRLSFTNEIFRSLRSKVAEATKVIENTQITLFNELTKIFDKMVIDTEALMLELGYIFIGIEY